MGSSDSVSDWILGAKCGDSSAIQHLWQRYFDRLVHLARVRLGDARLPGADAEDIAIRAFAAFCRGAEAGRFPGVKDRGDLWRLLIRITVQEAIDQLRREARLKRGGGRVRGDSAMEEIVGDAPTPEFAALVAEQTRRLLAALNLQLRHVALAKMEGYSNREIARRLGCSESTVERKLRLIREIWRREVA